MFHQTLVTNYEVRFRTVVDLVDAPANTSAPGHTDLMVSPGAIDQVVGQEAAEASQEIVQGGVQA